MNARVEQTPPRSTAWTFEIDEADMQAKSDSPGQREAAASVSCSKARAGALALAVRRLELSTVLRAFGAGVVLMAIGLFLSQRWEAGNDLFRYALLLGQTALLSLLGLGTGHWMKEPKSARVFLALGLVSSAASFTVFGALLYSAVQWDTVSVAYPGFAQWLVEPAHALSGWAGASAAVLVAVTALGFTTLARPARTALSALFLGNGLLLVAPVRDPAVSAALAAGAGIFSLMVLARLRLAVPALRTFEGRVARAAAVLPAAIIAVRCGYVYAAGPVSIACLSLLAYATVRQMAVNIGGRPAWRRLLEVVSLFPALVTAFAAAELVDRIELGRYGEELAVATFFVALVLALADLARRSQADGSKYARGATLVALLGGVLELTASPCAWTALGLALVSMGAAVYSRSVGFGHVYRLSLLCLVAGFGCYLYFVVEGLDLGGWVGLATLGVLAIALAAAIERHGERMQALISAALAVPSAK